MHEEDSSSLHDVARPDSHTSSSSLLRPFLFLLFLLSPGLPGSRFLPRRCSLPLRDGFTRKTMNRTFQPREQRLRARPFTEKFLLGNVRCPLLKIYVPRGAKEKEEMREREREDSTLDASPSRADVLPPSYNAVC